MSIVSVVAADDYRPATIGAAMEKHFDRLEAVSLLEAAPLVVLKPNLLTARRPEETVTTHPALIQATADWIHRQGVERVTVADSPGGPLTAGRLGAVYQASGMNTLTGVQLNEETGFQARSCPPGLASRQFNLIQPIAAAPVVFNMAKLKTHAMTRISAGIKNLFGCVPGLQKPELHYQYPDPEAFAGMLLDLALTVAPALTVLDAVEAMEGDGPSGGTTRRLGLTLASRDLFALDWVACTIMGIDPETVPMLRLARQRGLVTPEAIVVKGELPQTRPFVMPKAVELDFLACLPGALRKPARAVMKRVLKPRPVVQKHLCTGCGRCAESCPAHIIVVRDKKARIGRGGCISCFCCQEMCQAQAIRARHFFR